jgi:hypothetical protein
VPAGSPVLYADYIERSGTELYRAVCEMDLEGIVTNNDSFMSTPELSFRDGVRVIPAPERIPPARAILRLPPLVGTTGI